MKAIAGRLKKSLIIGLSAVVLLSAVPTAKNFEQSWFITFFSVLQHDDNNSITVINDSDEHIEFGFGLFDLFKRIFG